MRKVTVVGDSQIETRKRAWNERQAERMRQTRAAEKEAARQKRWQAHEQIINSMGHVAGPPADQIGANTDDLNPTELQHLMPAEFEELRDLMADDRLTESLALLGEIRARWRAEHGTPAAPTKPPALPNLASPTPRRSNKKAKIQ